MAKRKPLTDKQLAQGALTGWVYATEKVLRTTRTSKNIVATVELRIPIRDANEVNDRYLQTGSPIRS